MKLQKKGRPQLDELQVTERLFIKENSRVVYYISKANLSTEKWNKTQNHAIHSSYKLQEQNPKSLYRVDLAQQVIHF